MIAETLLINFDHIRVVLVETSHPGNIGAAARAMKTMGLSKLVLVAPKQFPSAEATAMASGADDLLGRARVVGDLDQALAGCGLVVGTTARSRTIAVPQLHPRAAMAEVLAVGRDTPVALVFGRERTGLTNPELDRCQIRVQIPANPDYSSLNLAAAVQVLAYELRMGATLLEETHISTSRYPPASYEEQEHFYAHLERVLLAIGFLDPDNPRLLMRRLRKLFGRARLDRNEVNILRGILSLVQHPRSRSGSGRSDK
ncbi:MAG: tRNA (cytosine(32)/uridine(32)-2'-O)-methyltransferase TrmJ [Candidatus Competibacteraceae bacterium]|nr:tRNA (cytosine(32)/uridine(32)-2'-O)-methyltransferase TrmJ [Candidatus Competibacteraceae bacterium]